MFPINLGMGSQSLKLELCRMSQCRRPRMVHLHLKTAPSGKWSEGFCPFGNPCRSAFSRKSPPKKTSRTAVSSRDRDVYQMWSINDGPSPCKEIEKTRPDWYAKLNV